MEAKVPKQLRNTNECQWVDKIKYKIIYNNAILWPDQEDTGHMDAQDNVRTIEMRLIRRRLPMLFFFAGQRHNVQLNLLHYEFVRFVFRDWWSYLRRDTSNGLHIVKNNCRSIQRQQK